MLPTAEDQRLQQGNSDKRRESGSYTSSNRSNRSRHSSEDQEGEDQGEYGQQDGQEVGSSDQDKYGDDDDSDMCGQIRLVCHLDLQLPPPVTLLSPTETS